MENARRDIRTPVTLKIKFKSENLDQFIERYSVDVSRGGIFIRTKNPVPVGTHLRFEFQLQDASPLISGEGTVVWIREHDPNRTTVAPGMGVRFDKLAPQSQQVLDKILAEKTRSSASADASFEAAEKPAPFPVSSESAGGQVSGAFTNRPTSQLRLGSMLERTPLPQPMPFGGEITNAGQDFGESDSTRVMAPERAEALVEETRDAAKKAAQKAVEAAAQASPADAARREDWFGDVMPPDKPAEAKAEAKPKPEEKAAPAPLAAPVVEEQAKPEPKAEAKPKAEPAKPKAEPAKPKAEPAKPKAEPAKPEKKEAPVEARKPAEKPAAVPEPHVADRPVIPASAGKSPPWAVIGGVVVVAAFAIYFVSTHGGPATSGATDAASAAAPVAAPVPAPAPAPKPAAVAPEPAAAPVPAGPTLAVETEPPGATLEVNGAAHPQPTPTTLNGLTAKKTLAIKASLPGYAVVQQRVRIKAENPPLKLVLKPLPGKLRVESTPPGATVKLDGRRLGRTPYTVARLDAMKEHTLELVLAGHEPYTQDVKPTDGWTFDPKNRLLTVSATLTRLAVPPPTAVAAKPAAAAKPEPKPAAVAAKPAAAARPKPAAVAAKPKKPIVELKPEPAALPKPKPEPVEPVALEPPKPKPEPAAKPKPPAAEPKPKPEPKPDEKPNLKKPDWMKG